MKISKVHLITFSPCGHTQTYGREMARACAEASGLPDFDEMNVTPHACGDSRSFSGSELVLLCSPVYGGRIPTVALEKFMRLNGQATPAILIVTYGNRHYDDSLLELVDAARAQGFWPVGAAACIAQHTLAPACAAGRPTQEDLASARNFAVKVIGQLAGEGEGADASLTVPGKSPYKDYIPKALPQSVNDACIMCGQCWTDCPTGAIATQEPANVAENRCLACMGCITICPVAARIPAEQFMQKVAKRLAPLCAIPKTNEYFYL